MTNNNDFLPNDYEAPKTGGSYMKLQKGENRFRILSKPILGWIDWQDNKPLRFHMAAKPAKPVDPKKSVKHFWAFVVWNCNEEKVQILEITQATIQSAIQALSKDEDWGSPFGYDIKVKRTGDGMETEYTVNPVPHSKVSKQTEEALVSIGQINLDALYEGADPFAQKAVVKETSDLPF